MADREKVIKGFEICDNNEDGIVCKNCPYKEDKWNGAWEDETGKTCFQTLHADVLALLKEQEKELLEFIGAVAKLTAENETLKMIYGNPGKIVGELIRCKDCKHYNSDKKWCQHMEVANGGKWFCADGERK